VLRLQFEVGVYNRNIFLTGMDAIGIVRSRVGQSQASKSAAVGMVSKLKSLTTLLRCAILKEQTNTGVLKVWCQVFRRRK
jgi:hypothetical protein